MMNILGFVAVVRISSFDVMLTRCELANVGYNFE
jgi:hypothetical protein